MPENQAQNAKNGWVHAKWQVQQDGKSGDAERNQIALKFGQHSVGDRVAHGFLWGVGIVGGIFDIVEGESETDTQPIGEHQEHDAPIKHAFPSARHSAQARGEHDRTCIILEPH